MEETYEEIVTKWYNKLRPEFLQRLTCSYSFLTLEDAENLYQDTFLAVYQNIQNNRVRPDTSWRSYILRIGMNLATKEWRKTGNKDTIDIKDGEELEKRSSFISKVEKKLRELNDDEDFRKTEARQILDDEISRVPQPCKSILEQVYFDNVSMDEIAKEFGYKNATTAKAKKWQCLKFLIARVKREYDSLERV